jgi:hypothetical protein
MGARSGACVHATFAAGRMMPILHFCGVGALTFPKQARAHSSLQLTAPAPPPSPPIVVASCSPLGTATQMIKQAGAYTRPLLSST